MSHIDIVILTAAVEREGLEGGHLDGFAWLPYGACYVINSGYLVKD
jgi:hypothetical protein